MFGDGLVVLQDDNANHLSPNVDWLQDSLVEDPVVVGVYRPSCICLRTPVLDVFEAVEEATTSPQERPPVCISGERHSLISGRRTFKSLRQQVVEPTIWMAGEMA